MADGAPGPRPRSALQQAVAEQFSVQAVIGGPRGLVESILPVTVFTIAWAITHDVTRSVVAALVPAVVFAVWRIVARENLTQAVSGVLGVALGAGVALYTGRGQDFFVPGIVKNIGLGAVYAVSAIVRWPLVGVLLGFTLGEDLHWRQVRPRLRVYQLATWVWVGVFAVRAAVQGWLYLAGETTTLGFANIALGLPLFAVAAGLTWLLVRRVPTAKPAPVVTRHGEGADADGEAPPAERGDDVDEGVSGGTGRG